MKGSQIITLAELELILGRSLTAKEKRHVAKHPITRAQLNMATAEQDRLSRLEATKRRHYRLGNGKCNCSGRVEYTEAHLIKVTRETIGGYYADVAS